MPYLNFVERCEQNDLCTMLPVLYRDLLEAKMDTLAQYHVEWSHINTTLQKPSTELDTFLITNTCTEAAAGLKLQCGREYFPGDEGEPQNDSRREKKYTD